MSLSSLPRVITSPCCLGKLYCLLMRLDQNDLPFSFSEEHDLKERLGFDGLRVLLGWLTSADALWASSSLLGVASCLFGFLFCFDSGSFSVEVELIWAAL